MINLQKALKTALDAAQSGALVLMSGYGGKKPDINYKGLIDLVTEYDLRSEEIIKTKILDQWPNHLVVGEEGGGYGSRQSPYKWYVDPLDGTTNFAHGHPFFAVSIGLFGPDESGEDRPLVGVV
ncbi:MAG: inositol monophosphatase family protein, partial [Candidatus Adiutrix sp.]